MKWWRQRRKPANDAPATASEPAEVSAAWDAWVEGAPEGAPGRDTAFVDCEYSWYETEETPESWLDQLVTALTAIMARRGVPVTAGAAYTVGGQLLVDLAEHPVVVHDTEHDFRRPVEGVDRLLGRLNQLAARAGSDRRWRVAYLDDAIGTAAFTTDEVAAAAPFADAWDPLPE